MRGRHRSRGPLWGTRRAGAAALGLAVCALAGAAPASAQTLTSIDPPTISPQPLVGGTVTATDGIWSESGLTFAYQWFDCDPSDPTSCEGIDGATTATYSPQSDDGDYTLEVAVTATDTEGNQAVATSAPTDAVAAPPGAPVIETGPTIGAVAVGQTATATLGTWTGSPTSYSEQWFSCTPDESDCEPVSGSTPTTYTVTDANVGAVLVFVVAAANSFGESIDELSTPSAVITDPPPTILISGPLNGASFPAGSAQTAQYACTAFDDSPLNECEATDSSGAAVYSGGPIDTSQPGQYTITVTAIDGSGASATASVTYTVTAASVPAAGSGSGSASPALSLTALRQSSSRWHLGSALPTTRAADATTVGTVFAFTASAAGQVTYRFTRRLAGRMHDGRCVAATHAERHARACTRTHSAGSMTLAAHAGANRDEFDGRLSATRRLDPGAYTVVVTARASGSAKTVTVGRLRFTIVG